MPEVFTSPGDQRDGGAPYSQHLTGAVDWQKVYGAMKGPTAAVLLQAGLDHLIPLPILSADMSVDAIYVSVSVAGDPTAVLRTAIYDMTTFPGGTLIAAPAEDAVGAATGVRTHTFAAVTLKKNTRYAGMLCGNAGVTMPTMLMGYSTEGELSWLGMFNTTLLSIGRVRYTRAYAAFPDPYNGVWQSIHAQRPQMCLRLP
jgi:hypothetical protein